MTNFEWIKANKPELFEKALTYSLAFTKSGEAQMCKEIECVDCIFYNGDGVCCQRKREEFLKAQHKIIEPIKVGDLVTITDSALMYTTYIDWVLANVTDVSRIAKYAYGVKYRFDPLDRFEVVAIAPHGTKNDTLVYLERLIPFSKVTKLRFECYLISMKGIKKV